MLQIKNKVKVLEGYTPENIDDQIFESLEPLILKDYAASWPLVIASKQSPQHAADYLREFYKGFPLTACVGSPETKGRVFYNEDLTGFNYQASRVELDFFLKKIFEHIDDPEPPMMYIGSTEIDRCLPGLKEQNSFNIDHLDPITYIWMGNQSRIAAHYDFPCNLACPVVGRRRFTLFPPEQVKNLYPGPLEFAPGGQEISLVDFHEPDFDKFPRFEQAIEAAQLAELDVGDALFLPSMWWHHVEGLDSFNVLITNWWRKSSAHLGRPTNALLHACLALRDLPENERQAWKAMFEYHIFDRQPEDIEHIPPAGRLMMNLPLDASNAAKIKSELINKLRR